MATRSRNMSRTTRKGRRSGRWEGKTWLALFDISSEDLAELRSMRKKRPAGTGASIPNEALPSRARPSSAVPDASELDDDYFASRRRLGRDHEKMGLAPQELVAAHSRSVHEVILETVREHAGDPDRLAHLLGTCSKIAFLDIALAMDGCLARSLESMSEHRQRLERTVAQRTRALAESERKYRQIVENARDSIWALDFRGRWTLLNKGISGYSREELLAHGFTLLERLHPPESLDAFHTALETVRKTKKGIEGVATTHVNPFSGEEEHYLSNLQPVFDRRNRVAGVQGISHNVTERKNLEASLRRSEERYREVIESAPEMIHQVDGERRFITVNRTELKKLGYRLEEMIQRRLEDLVPPEMREALLAHFRRVVTRGRGTHQTVLLTRAGSPIEVEMNDMALSDPRGGLIAVVSLLQDISERKALEWQILRAERLAAIGELTASFAHEVGTPLNVILSRAEYLMDGLNPEDPNRKSLEVIASQIDRIKGTLSRLLEFSRGYEPKLERDVPLSKVLKDVVEVLEHELSRTGIRLRMDVAPDLPGVVADPHQMTQIFMNLLMNSIQAIPDQGEILVRAAYLGEQAFLRAGTLITTPLVRVSVTDTGVGIPRENVTKIFTPFFSTRERGQGTGLGLCVVDRIVRNHGGMVSVQSECGKGSTFNVDLPVEGPGGV